MNRVSHAHLNYLHGVNYISSHTTPEGKRCHIDLWRSKYNALIYTCLQISRWRYFEQSIQTVLDNTLLDNKVLLETVTSQSRQKAIQSMSHPPLSCDCDISITSIACVCVKNLAPNALPTPTMSEAGQNIESIKAN